jgi:hypothetical protein
MIAVVASPRPFVAIDGKDLNNNNVTFDDFVGPDRVMRPEGSWENWYKTVDLRLQRALIQRGTQKITLMAEVFNVFNSENILSYGGQKFNGTTPITTFGQSTGAFAARQAQVGLKVDF